MPNLVTWFFWLARICFKKLFYALVQVLLVLMKTMTMRILTRWARLPVYVYVSIGMLFAVFMF